MRMSWTNGKKVSLKGAGRFDRHPIISGIERLFCPEPHPDWLMSQKNRFMVRFGKLDKVYTKKNDVVDK